jgi:hypothetical protein
VVAEFAGEDMSWFLDQFLYGSGRLDYAVSRISNRTPSPPRGWFGETYRESSPSAGDDQKFTTEILVQRLGEVKVPITVEILFQNGHRLRENWDGQYRWKKFRFETPSKVEQVIVDPDFVYVSDINRTNNSLKQKSNTLAPLRWASKWLLWLQHALEFMALLGG